MPKNSVTVQVPATTSNLGPGFDTLGIALNLYARVSVMRTSPPSAGAKKPAASLKPGINLVSTINEEGRAGARAILEGAAGLFFERSGTNHFGADVAISGDIPVARGLGSSVGVRLGVIAGLNQLSGAGLSRDALLEMVAELEGHPDNAAPAVFGGFAIAGRLEDRLHCLHYRVPSRARFVTLIPNFEISTEKARALLPDRFPKADVIQNLNRVALIAAVFARGRIPAERLPGLFHDRLHQPYREKLLPALQHVIRAGETAGALGGWLSGSGSTIICLTLATPEKVARAMQSQLPDSSIKILRADNEGFTIS